MNWVDYKAKANLAESRLSFRSSELNLTFCACVVHVLLASPQLSCCHFLMPYLQQQHIQRVRESRERQPNGASAEQRSEEARMQCQHNIVKTQVEEMYKSSPARSTEEKEFYDYQIDVNTILFQGTYSSIYLASHNQSVYPLIGRVYEPTARIDPQRSSYMKVLNHIGQRSTGCISTYDIFYDDAGRVVIFQEFAALGNLKDYLKHNNVYAPEPQLHEWAVQIYRGMDFLVRNIMDNWPFGETLCKLVPFVQALSVYVSVLSMTMIAIDRYQALIKPLKRRMSHRVPKSVLIAFIWSVAAVLAAPNAVFNIVAEIKMTNTIVPSTVATEDSGSDIEYHEEVLYRCKTIYPNNNDILYQRISTCIAFTTQFLVPLLIVGLCYTMIGLKISKRACIGETTVEQAQTHLNAKRKTIKMLIFVVACFAICWLPYNLLYLFKDFGELNFSLTLHYLTHWLAMSSICYNPFIYFWLNNGYRQGILSVLTCCCTTSSMVAQTTDPEQNRTTIFQRSLSRSYSSGFQPNPNLNYINNLNSNNNNNNAQNSIKSGEKEINLSRLKSSLLSVPSFTNGSQSKNNDSNNNSNGSSNGSAGTTSRHLQIIYISLKEKYSKDDDDDEETEDIELSGGKNETDFKRNKKSPTRFSSEMASTDGEYFELMECIHKEKAIHLEEEADLGLKFKSG